MRRRGSLSARLRAEVQSSTRLWGGSGGDQQQGGGSDLSAYPCDVKPGVFFYKFLQPFDARPGAGGGARRLRVNLPLTVVAERLNGQEAVLWLETDASGCVERVDKAPAWRRKLHGELLEHATPLAAAAPSRDGALGSPDAVLAVRTTPRWRPKPSSSGCGTASTIAASAGAATAAATATSASRTTVVLTTETFDLVVNTPSELPVSVQRFVRSRGLQASVYRVHWDESGRHSFAVNLLNGPRFSDAPLGSSTALSSNAPALLPSAAALSEQALARAAALAEFFCVATPTDPKALAKLTKIRGKPVAEPIEAAKRVAEHAQLHLPGVRFRAMTLEFLRDTDGTWWLLSVVDFRASVSGLEGVEEDALDSDPHARASAVHLADLQRTRQLCRPRSVPVLPPSVAGGGAAGAEGLMTRSCFLCGSLCELSAELKREVLALMKGDPSMSRSTDDTREMLHSIADYRMTLKMALETVYLLRQRGVVLRAWEAALQAVRRSPVQGVVEFGVCLLCYRVFKHQQSLQKIAHELHVAFGSLDTLSPPRSDALLAVSGTKAALGSVATPLVGLGAIWGAASAMSAFTAGFLSPELFEVRTAKPPTTTGEGGAGGGAVGATESGLLAAAAPKRPLTAPPPPTMLDRITSFQREAFPAPLASHHAHAVDEQHSQYEFAVVDGGAVDPSSAQLRVVLFFHELQDGGPELTPTDFFLEYQLGQSFNRIHLEGSKCHTPNRWQLCEARVHYTLATVEAFAEYCADKKLLIKMKRHASSLGSGGAETGQAGGDEFFGYSVLSLKPLLAAAKCFSNSLLPEARTDYLLELHTTRYGLLTLKLTAGLLVDPVPLRNVRDVVCSRAFLEERAPAGRVYWPPPALCLCGLAIPRDWVGALMPSEYISILPMRARTHPGAGGRRAAGISFGPGTRQQQPHPHSKANGTPAAEGVADEATQPPTGSEDGPGASSDSLSSSMSCHAALSRACMAATSLAKRVVDDSSVAAFPTALLASIMRQTRFHAVEKPDRAGQAGVSRVWSEPATFHWTRKLSIDQLLALTRAPLRPTLALLGELLLVLRRNRLISDTVDASRLEELVRPFWLQKGLISPFDGSADGWTAIPRTSAHLPEHRAVWNRAIRRCDAARRAASASKAQQEAPSSSSTRIPSKSSSRARSSRPNSPVARGPTPDESLHSAFRYTCQTLTLCDLFEEMEALDNGYVDIAELRSLRKVHELVGTRERLTADEITSIARQVDDQQRRTAVATLQSMMESAPMVDALERFDRQGYGYLSFDDFQRLADDALQTDRGAFRAFRKEPTTTGFCIRHGTAGVFAIDTVCVLCTKQFVDQSLEEATDPTEGAAADAPVADASTHSLADAGSDGGGGEAPVSIASSPDGSTSPSRRHERQAEFSSLEVPLRRRRTLTSCPSFEGLDKPAALDTELHTTLERLRAAEWHVRHRQESMGKASFSQMIAEQSAQRAARRALRRTAIMCSTNNQGESAAASRHGSTASTSTCAVSGMPRLRESACFVAPKDHPTEPVRASGVPATDTTSKPRAPKRKRKAKRTQSRAPSFMAMAAPPLSSLLRAELATADASTRTGGSRGGRSNGPELHAARSADLLIEKVSRTEAKRKQLDQLVLAELDEVKQRLARLLHER